MSQVGADPENCDQVETAAALLKYALALVDDPVLARSLVARTLESAAPANSSAPLPSKADLFRLLRQAYHSIEHSRSRRSLRDALVNSLAAQQQLARARGRG